LPGSLVVTRTRDHFHPPTVEKLPKSARVFYPYAWYGGIKPYLNELGFRDVTEAPTDKTIRVTPDTAVTYWVNNLDSIIVIESNGQVFVNVNDALHSHPPRIVDVFVQHVRERWPRIDTVFCGLAEQAISPILFIVLGRTTWRLLMRGSRCLFMHSAVLSMP